MIKFLLHLALVTAVVCTSLKFHRDQRFSAATPAQIRFAEENKYDDTGPGAKDPRLNQIYRTYKNLDEALVAYLDDPDTKLPHHELAKALQTLDNLNDNQPFHKDRRYPVVHDKNINIYSPRHNPVVHDQNIIYNPHLVRDNHVENPVDLSAIRISDDFSRLRDLPSYQSPLRWQKLKEVWPNPISLRHFSWEPHFNGRWNIGTYSQGDSHMFDNAAAAQDTAAESYSTLDSSPAAKHPRNPYLHLQHRSMPQRPYLKPTEHLPQRRNPSVLSKRIRLSDIKIPTESTLHQPPQNLHSNNVTQGLPNLLNPYNTESPLSPDLNPYRGHYTYWDQNGRLHMQYKDEARRKIYIRHHN